MKKQIKKILACEICKREEERSIHASKFVCRNCRKEGKKLFRIEDSQRRKEIARKAALSKHEKYLENRERKIRNADWSQLTNCEKRERILMEQNGKCMSCGISQEWNNKPLKFELDHMNGNRNDNRRENLRLICPNCHSQTNNYKNRNIPKPGKTIYKEEEIVKALEKCDSIYKAMKKLGMNPHGGNYRRIRKIVEKYNLTDRFIF